MLLFINWPPCLFLLRRQTCGGRFFLRTIWTSPDVTSLFRKIFTAWFLCAPIIPGVLDPSFIRILRGFHFQLHLQVFMSSKPEHSSSCPYFALDSWLLSILILVDAFKAIDDSEWSKLELPRSCLDLDLSLNCLYDFFNSSFAYRAVWGSLPILFGTRITTYLCWDSFSFWKT